MLKEPKKKSQSAPQPLLSITLSLHLISHRLKGNFPKSVISTKRPKVAHKNLHRPKNRCLMLLCAVFWSLVFAFALVCKLGTVYFLVSISIHTAHRYLYESGIGLSAVMKFHIHEISTAISIPGTRQGITYVNYVW